MSEEFISQADKVGEMEARGYVGRVDGMQRNIFAVRQDGELGVYLNKCPHAGALLDHIQRRFLTPDGKWDGQTHRIDSDFKERAKLNENCWTPHGDRIAKMIRTGYFWNPVHMPH